MCGFRQLYFFYYWRCGHYRDPAGPPQYEPCDYLDCATSVKHRKPCNLGAQLGGKCMNDWCNKDFACPDHHTCHIRTHITPRFKYESDGWCDKCRVLK